MAPTFDVRLPALSRVLTRARRGVKQLDRGLLGLEVLNSNADHRRGPAEWERMRGEADCCFVLSTGRTGTASLEALLDLSPSIAPHHEPEPRLITASYLAWTGVEDVDFWRQAVQVARDTAVFEALKTGKLYFEASNRMTFLAPALAAAYPKARFLIVTRRAKGFITSGVKRGFYAGHPWDHARPRPKGGWEGEPSLEEKCGWLWRETYRYALDFMAAEPDRTQLLHAEDLFAGDLDRVQRVFDFLGVDAPPRRAMQAVIDAPRNAQGGAFPWGREPSIDNKLLESLADMEQRLGYDV